MAIVEIQWTDCVHPDDGTRAQLFVSYDNVPDAQGRLEIRSARCVNSTPVTVQSYIVDTGTTPNTRVSSDVGPGLTQSWNVPRRRYFLTTDADGSLFLPTDLQVGMSCH